MDKIQELEQKPIGKLLIQYSVPTVLSLLINSLYIVIDRMFIGNIPKVGTLALTGIGLTMPITLIVVALSALISMGASSNISMKLGEDNKEEAENFAGNALSLSIVLGLLVTSLYLIFQNSILGWLGINGEILSYTKDFITIIMAGTIFNMLGFSLPFIVRSDGNPIFSAVITITGCILNIFLDALFIYVFHMGIKGAAIATVLAQFTTVILGLYYLIKLKNTLMLKKSNFKLHLLIIKDIFLIGLVPFSNQISISIAQIVSNYSLNLYGGELAIGAMTVLNSITMLFLMPVYGIAQGFQPIIGYNYAKKNYDRTLKTLALAVFFSTGFLAVGTIIMQLFPKFAVSLFTQNPELVNISINGLKKYTVLIFLVSIPTFGAGFMMLTGKPKTAVLLSISRQSVILALTIFFLPKVIGQDGLWFAQPITDLLSSIITIIIFIKGYSDILYKKKHQQGCKKDNTQDTLVSKFLFNTFFGD
ncbi:MATE family efflux transporter [Clostridium beijerinckii]|uniref:MATE family efflux transporter n=1 Tax=Clostridium beijerinckii TaxID=1520 RepID=UPI000AD19847|nr:MATE family efflux transporter [Clostridium beijerinckii]